MTTDAEIRDILTTVKTVALVGASMNPARASHRVGQYLADHGYRVIPVNPGQVGKRLFGTEVVARLSDIAEPVDMIDIFRRSEHVLPIVEDAVSNLAGLQVVWMQLEIWNNRARALAEAHGLRVVEDRCPAIEIPRLGL